MCSLELKGLSDPRIIRRGPCASKRVDAPSATSNYLAYPKPPPLTPPRRVGSGTCVPVAQIYFTSPLNTCANFFFAGPRSLGEKQSAVKTLEPGADFQKHSLRFIGFPKRPLDVLPAFANAGSTIRVFFAHCESLVSGRCVSPPISLQKVVPNDLFLVVPDPFWEPLKN